VEFPPPRRALALGASVATTVLRSGAGIGARAAARRPRWLFELYEFEGCPHCRLVREALTELDLDTLVYPCPKGGTRFRPRAEALGGRLQFPFLVDPNREVRLHESHAIVAYLFEHYGGGPPSARWRLPALQTLGSVAAGLPRLGAGLRARPARAPEQPLELYAFEGSPFARLVRERLCELELPWILRSCGRTRAGDWVPPAVRDALELRLAPETVNRRALLARAGRITIPWLVDRDAGVELGESAAILDHLEETYAR
jgi:glutathione S-transferase